MLPDDSRVSPPILPALVGLPCPPPERRPGRSRPPHHHPRGAAGHVPVVASALVGIGERGVGRVQPDDVKFYLYF